MADPKTVGGYEELKRRFDAKMKEYFYLNNRNLDLKTLKRY